MPQGSEPASCPVPPPQSPQNLSSFYLLGPPFRPRLSPSLRPRRLSARRESRLCGALHCRGGRGEDRGLGQGAWPAAQGPPSWARKPETGTAQPPGAARSGQEIVFLRARKTRRSPWPSLLSHPHPSPHQRLGMISKDVVSRQDIGPTQGDPEILPQDARTSHPSWGKGLARPSQSRRKAQAGS